jgi:hypothetical protein
VSVTKVKYSNSASNTGNGKDVAFAVDNNNESASKSENAPGSLTWIQPTLIAGAALLFIATSSAAMLVFRLKNSSQQHPEIQGKPTDESPRSLEETAAPSTPTPIFSDRWKKKKFDYAEFHDEAEDSACAMTPTTAKASKYFDQPARDIKFSQFMSNSFEDSSVSDVSGHMLGAKGSMKESGAAKEDSSQAESFLLDTTMDSYNMETMSELNARLENVLQLDGASPQATFGLRTDEASLMTSELYSDVNTSTDSPLQSYDYDTGAAYASHLITLDMIKNNSMPPPPSDAASDSSSYQDDGLSEVDQNLHYGGSCGLEERLIQNAKSHHVQMSSPVSSRTKTEMINDELSKVMKLLKTPSKDGDDYVDDYGSPESSAEIYIPSGSDTESLASSVSVIGGLTRKNKECPNQETNDGNSTLSADATNNTILPPQDRKLHDLNAPDDEISPSINKQSDPENEENDPLQAMNMALNECIQILDKAAARV